MIQKNLSLRTKRVLAILFYVIVLLGLIELFVKWSQDRDLFSDVYIVKEPITWVVYHNETYPISIQYPQGWVVENRTTNPATGKDIIAILEPFHSAFYPWVYIAHRSMSSNSAIEIVADWGEERLSEVDYEIISTEETIIEEEQALVRKLFFIKPPSKRVDCFHVYMLDDVDAYMIALCTDKSNDSPELQAVWQRMIESISIR